MQRHVEQMVQDYERGRLSRRQLIAHLSGLAALATAGCATGSPSGSTARSAVGSAAAAPTAMPEAGSTFVGTDINHIALAVTDIGRSRDFYQKHLGLTVASEGGSSAFLRCNEKNFVALFKSEKPGMDHYCYSIREYEPADAVERLAAVGIEARRRGNRIYFDDPDGLEVQVSSKSHTV